jgi:hypothetical protein
MYAFDAGRYITRAAGQVGGGWALEIETFLGPVKWHRAIRRVPFGAQKIEISCVQSTQGKNYSNTAHKFSPKSWPPTSAFFAATAVVFSATTVEGTAVACGVAVSSSSIAVSRALLKSAATSGDLNLNSYLLDQVRLLHRENE